MWSVTGMDRRLCPPEYQSRISELGGLNKFGEPNWRVVWGQTQTERVGGLWEYGDGTKVAEMRDVLRYDGAAVWALERWFPPENYGTEWQWYRENADPKSGLPLLGGYPDQGEYEPCIRIHGELNDYVIDSFIQLILKTHETTAKQRQIAVRDYRLKIEQEDHDRKVEMYIEKVPAYTGPVSYAGQRIKTARVDRAGVAREVLRKMSPSFGQVN